MNKQADHPMKKIQMADEYVFQQSRIPLGMSKIVGTIFICRWIQPWNGSKVL